MALNDLLKHMPGVDNVLKTYSPSDEMNFENFNHYKVLMAPPFSNVSLIN